MIMDTHKKSSENATIIPDPLSNILGHALLPPGQLPCSRLMAPASALFSRGKLILG